MSRLSFRTFDGRSIEPGQELWLRCLPLERVTVVALDDRRGQVRVETTQWGTVWQAPEHLSVTRPKSERGGSIDDSLSLFGNEKRL